MKATTILQRSIDSLCLIRGIYRLSISMSPPHILHVRGPGLDMHTLNQLEIVEKRDVAAEVQTKYRHHSNLPI